MKRLCVASTIVFFVLPFLACLGVNLGSGRTSTSPTTTAPVTPATPTTPTTPVSPGCVAGTVTDPTNSTAIPHHVRVTLEAAYVENGIHKFDIIGYPYVPGTDGSFNLCYPAASTNGARYMVVVTASTETGLMFAPVVVPSVQPNTSVGAISLGGNTAPQSDSPVRIDFAITSTPAAVTGAIFLDLISPDPLVAGGTMHFPLPLETSSVGSLIFNTVAGSSCSSAFCAQGSISAPSLPPIWKNATGYTPAATSANYKLRAGTFSSTSFPISATCNWVETSIGTNGQSLTAAPGAILTASTLAFTGC